MSDEATVAESAAASPLPSRAVARIDRILPASRPRRVLLFAKRKAHTRVPTHLARGFRALGHRVLWLRPGRWQSWLGRAAVPALVRRTLAFRPDLILVYKHDAPSALLDALPHTALRVVYYEDVPRDLESPGEALLDVARRCDLLTTTAEGMIPVFERLGVRRAVYLRGGVDPVDHRPGRRRPQLACEAAFIGRPFGAERMAVLRAVASRGGLSLFGQGWEDAFGVRPVRRHVYPPNYRDICASAKVMLGVDLRSDVAAYFSNRTWLTLGCRGFLLTRYVVGLEEFFTNHKHLVWFESVDQCVELLEHYLARDAERERIAEEGHAYVHAYHTFRHAAAELCAQAFGGAWHRASP